MIVVFGAQIASADTYTFVGSYHVGDGPVWSQGSPVALSAQQAAALIFGGNASDYAISTNSNTTDSSTITFTGLYDGYGHHAAGGTEFAENFVQQCQVEGTYATNGVCTGWETNPSWSAYIRDAYGPGQDPTNYVWRVEETPEPGSIMLLGSGLLGLAGGIRRKLSL